MNETVGCHQAFRIFMGSPSFLARKKDGTLRYCIDYHKLNQVIQKDS